MRIYKMTATFGKLNHETLTLEPGLNVIQAPNEWGKSTWCAFLLAMLYGLDTRAKTTKSTLADKERYAPWSGSPMEGRIDLCWKGRDITIERTTRRRVPLGEFKAYETETGLPVPELTAANCGSELLGVEQSVFRRAGFIRFADLPVTQDEALRRRLNALVTTGDERGRTQRLETQLRDLKNRCRYNRSGLLPQAEEEQRKLEGKLRELRQLREQSRELNQRLQELEADTLSLENHLQALDYAQAREGIARVEQAEEALSQARQRLEAREKEIAALPSREQAQEKLHRLKQLRQQWSSLEMEREMLPPEPEEPLVPAPFSVAEPEKMLRGDTLRYEALAAPRELGWYLLAAGALLTAVGLYLGRLGYWPAAALAAAVLSLVLAMAKSKARRTGRRALEEKYGSPDPVQWARGLEAYTGRRREYLEEMARYRCLRGDLDQRSQELQLQRQSLCARQTPEQVQELWEQITRQWEEYHALRREVQRWESHCETLRAMVTLPAPPQREDPLTLSRKETRSLLEEADREHGRLQNRLGQYQGRMELLGREPDLEKALAQVSDRIQKLEDLYGAAAIALETLAQARQELQRRFAPRISRRARELMEAMTCGRYNRLRLGSDFSLEAGAAREDTLQSALWRSDGTVDQLYLALRLAVAEALTGQAPLVLDDALVRFDDTRLRAALAILQDLAREKQVLLFTCQDRENRLLERK